MEKSLSIAGGGVAGEFKFFLKKTGSTRRLQEKTRDFALAARVFSFDLLHLLRNGRLLVDHVSDALSLCTEGLEGPTQKILHSSSRRSSTLANVRMFVAI